MTILDLFEKMEPIHDHIRINGSERKTDEDVIQNYCHLEIKSFSFQFIDDYYETCIILHIETKK